MRNFGPINKKRLYELYLSKGVIYHIFVSRATRKGKSYPSWWHFIFYYRWSTNNTKNNFYFMFLSFYIVKLSFNLLRLSDKSLHCFYKYLKIVKPINSKLLFNYKIIGYPAYVSIVSLRYVIFVCNLKVCF